MRMVGDGSGEGRLHGRVSKERGTSSSSVVAILLSDSDSDSSSVGIIDEVQNGERAKLKMIAEDHVFGMQDEQQQVLDKALGRLLAIFPDACPLAAAANLSLELQHNLPGTALERIVHRHIEHGVLKAKSAPPEEPKPEVPQVLEKPLDIRARSNVQGVGTSNHGEQPVDMGVQVVPPDIQANYIAWSMYTLTKEFPRYPLMELKRVLAENSHRFAPSYKAISSEYATALAAEHVAEQNGQFGRRLGRPGHSKLNLRPRDPSRHLPSEPCNFFEKEWQVVQNALGEGAENTRRALKSDINPDCDNDKDACEGEASGNIECGCCYSDYRFEEMAQCAEGHLFCFICLRRRVEESTFGGARACSSLPCMDTSGCEEFFPWSEVKRALPPDVLAKYEQRQAEDAVVQAKLTGLVYCPFCNMPWEVDPELRVLECANESCKKESCLLCREPSHIPLRCEEVEKKSETSLRRSIEERMTKALIRVCTVCKAELVKSDGCNKITCRCGKTMCYVCRQPIAPNYSHFCQHTRAPKTECTVCTKCSLWQTEEEDEIVEAAREAAMKELAQDDPNLLKRTIGPKLEKEPKKKHKPPPIPAVPFRPPPPEYYNRMAQAMIGVAEQLM